MVTLTLHPELLTEMMGSGGCKRAQNWETDNPHTPTSLEKTGDLIPPVTGSALTLKPLDSTHFVPIFATKM